MDATGIAILGIAAALALAAWLIRIWDARFRARARRASGTVIGFRVETERQERDGEETFTDLHRPVFRYRDAMGVAREALSRVASSPPAYETGAVVPILYDPARPQEAVPEHDPIAARLPLLLALLAAAGAAFVLLRAAFTG